MSNGHQVFDITCQWEPKIMSASGNAACVVNGDLVLSLDVGQGRRTMTVKLGQRVPLPGEPGASAVFQLVQIWPQVLKLTPSLVCEGLHAFITIVGAPTRGRP